MGTITQESIFSFGQKPNWFSVLMQDTFLELQQGHNNSLSSPNLTLGMPSPLRERWYYTTAFLRTLFSKVLSSDKLLSLLDIHKNFTANFNAKRV